MLAESYPSVPWPLILGTLLGLIGLLGIYVLVAQAIVISRKAFGKVPPLHDQIAKMREEFAREIASNEANLERWMADHEKEDAEEFKTLRSDIGAVESDVKQFRAEVIHNGDIRKRDIENKVQQSHDQLEKKLDDAGRDLRTEIGSVRKDLQAQTNELLRAIGRIEGNKR